MEPKRFLESKAKALDSMTDFWLEKFLGFLDLKIVDQTNDALRVGFFRALRNLAIVFDQQ